MMIDTHCHLDFPEFGQDLPSVLKRAEENNVKYFINVSSSAGGCLNGYKLACAYPNIFYTVGIHPHHADEVNDDMLLALGGYFNNEKKPCAIGEVGLDYYRDLSSRDAQMKLFRYFLRLKKKADLPIIIHLRESEADLFGVVDEELALPVDGVVHCFSQGLNGLKAALDRGFFISFTCNITYKNAQTLRDVAKYVPLDRLLLETDAPYLAPQALRGRRNESANLVHLRDALAAVRGVSVDDIEEATTANAVRLFRLNIER